MNVTISGWSTTQQESVVLVDGDRESSLSDGYAQRSLSVVLRGRVSIFESRRAMTSVTDEEIETVWPGRTAQTTTPDDAGRDDAPVTDDAGQDDAPPTDAPGQDQRPGAVDDAPPTDAPAPGVDYWDRS
jgi:hypothetical protein